jgi:hypothetical protein
MPGSILKETPPVQPEVEKGQRLKDIFGQSFIPVFKNNGDIYQAFFALTKKLNKFFSLSRAILAVYSPARRKLKVIAMRSKNSVRKGLALTLSENNSLLYRVFKDGDIYILDFPDEIKVNFIETKLLIGRETASLAVCPVTSNDNIIGLLGLSSPIPYAFTMFDGGFLDGVLEEFGRLVESERNRLMI